MDKILTRFTVVTLSFSGLLMGVKVPALDGLCFGSGEQFDYELELCCGIRPGVLRLSTSTSEGVGNMQIKRNAYHA